MSYRFRQPPFVVTVEPGRTRPLRPGNTVLHFRTPKDNTTMRFMVLVKASAGSEAGVLPDEKMIGRHGETA